MLMNKAHVCIKQSREQHTILFRDDLELPAIAQGPTNRLTLRGEKTADGAEPVQVRGDTMSNLQRQPRSASQVKIADEGSLAQVVQCPMSLS